MLVTTPSPIPRSRKYEPDDLDEPLVMWVHTGTMQLSTDDGRQFRLDAGSGVWLPPHTPHDFWTDPGALVLPLWGLDAPQGSPDEVAGFEVPREAAGTLIDLYPRHAFGYLPGMTGSPLPPELASQALVPSARPPMPRVGPALRVATQLSSRPGLDKSLEEWAAWASCSPNTLRRGFLAQTGMTFARWRQLSRLAHAAELLAAGAPTGLAAAAVGFASRWGFTGAFRAQYGLTPREYSAQRPETVPGVGEPDPMFEPTGEVCQENLMLWVRAGELRAVFDDETWVGCEGDVIWLPAGALIVRAPESAVPLSVLCTECVQLERPRKARFSRAWTDWLLWASVSTNTLARPARHHGFRPRLERPMHAHVIDAFEAQVAVERARRVPMPDHAAARAAATAFLRSVGSASEVESHEVPDDVREVFRRDTGMTFTDWRHAARMRIARGLLQDGHPSGGVARRVGYTRSSNFSRAFSRFHGIGPREFQLLEGPEDHLLVG
ncbi:MAG: AraC family transcriptional regulator [Micropruina sp.]|uniref:helix-turn-helix domain-containing protein n=1 Tax=Micropruina sp. TaxID=2737536 RepID=UPI0039E5AD31